MIRSSNVLAALLAAPFSILLFWLVTAAIDRQPPIIYDHVRALAADVPQGGTIEVEFSVFRLRICDVEARRWLYDASGRKHSIPSFTVGPRQLAGLDTYRRLITIPEAAAVGQASYVVELAFACNLVHRLGWPIRVLSPPIRFEVTPRPLIFLPPLLSQPPDSDG